MFKNILNSIQEKIDTKKKENDLFNELIDKTTIFQNLYPIPTTSVETPIQKITYITNTCPDINKEKAKTITSLIPIEETILTVLYSKEILTDKEYYLVPTNKYLWVINPTNFGAFPYENLTIQIIKNNIMSKIVLLNNILLEINGTDSKIENLINILNPDKRETIIKEKTSYLCGIIPIYQKINNINSGISIDNQSNIVFHAKEKNYKYNIQEIEDFEILLDNQVVLSKNSQSSKSIGNFQNSCYQISIRIKSKDNTIINIPILEQNSFGTKYQRQDTIFQTNFNFAEEIINKLKSITPKDY